MGQENVKTVVLEEDYAEKLKKSWEEAEGDLSELMSDEDDEPDTYLT